MTTAESSETARAVHMPSAPELGDNRIKRPTTHHSYRKVSATRAREKYLGVIAAVTSSCGTIWDGQHYNTGSATTQALCGKYIAPRQQLIDGVTVSFVLAESSELPCEMSVQMSEIDRTGEVNFDMPTKTDIALEDISWRSRRTMSCFQRCQRSSYHPQRLQNRQHIIWVMRKCNGVLRDSLCLLLEASLEQSDATPCIRRDATRLSV